MNLTPKYRTPMLRHLFSTILLLVLPFLSDDPLRPFRQEATKWEQDIAAFEKLDATPVQEGTILFTGSSSIRMWNSLDNDLAPYPCLNRGFGGCKMTDVAIYADRILKPHPYRALVVFAANDVTGSESDHTPEQVRDAFESIVLVSQQLRPEAPVFIIAVTPTESRWKSWPKIQEVNQALQRFAESHPQVHYIDTVASYLNDQGRPRSELFQEDRLHQNTAGYQIWTRHIKATLDSHLTAP